MMSKKYNKNTISKTTKINIVLLQNLKIILPFSEITTSHHFHRNKTQKPSY